ncbi:hypothetical protein BT93_H1923 [Corymbia citriodora subsp. variegata]|nr:hypothetical protein BT93_H1923 [Corymbia citriodora subsp. variegata]
MFFASKVGIPIFVTGGIGGVHRHGENSKFTLIGVYLVDLKTIQTGDSILLLNIHGLL